MSVVCGKSGCQYKPKQFGVCGVHKSWAYQDNSPSFQSDIQELQNLYQQYHSHAQDLENQGYDPLQIQGYWNNNLTQTPVDKLPPHFYQLGLLMNQIKDKIVELQQTYNNYLVYNIQVRLNHQFGSAGCTCQYCQLGM